MLHTRRASPVSFFFHGSSDCSGQLAQTPWPTTRGRGLLRPDWVSLAVKSFNDLAQFFAIKNFSAARHIRVYTKHVHMLQLLHELFHLLLAVRAEAACATASASSWASRSGSSNTRRAGATAAASQSQSKGLLGAAGWGLGWGWGPGGAGGRGWRLPGPGGRGAGGWGLGRGVGGCTSHTCPYQACPCASVASRTVPPAPGCTGRSRLRHCQCKQLCQPKRIQQHPAGAGGREAGLGLGVGGWGLGAGGSGRLGTGGGWDRALGGWKLGWGLGAVYGGWGWGPGAGAGGWGAGAWGAGPKPKLDWGWGWGTGGRGLGAGTRLRHTRDTRERFANASRTLRANACERLRTLRGRFANALATIPSQPLDPWTPTFKTGTLLLHIRE